MDARTLVIIPEYPDETEKISYILSEYGYYPARFGSIIIFHEAKYPNDIMDITDILDCRGFCYEVVTPRSTPEELLKRALLDERQ